jgi:hypothetical protein
MIISYFEIFVHLIICTYLIGVNVALARWLLVKRQVDPVK